MEEIVKKALMKADLAKEGEIAFVAVEKDGMVYKIWYRAVGSENALVRYKVVTLEEWEWEKHGCKNNEEWHRYLNRSMWADYRGGLDYNSKKQQAQEV